MIDSLKHTFEENGKAIALAVVAVVAIVLFLFVLNSPGFGGVGSADGRFNRADVMFMVMMTPHHQQAVEMAEMAPGNTDNENILALAENISTSQRQEIEQMEEWLGEEDVGARQGNARMGGMATEQEMAELNRSEGEGFDDLFAELMIEHHAGGIHMAKMVVRNGRSEALRELAKGMIRMQQKEIDQMRAWRDISPS